MTEASPIAPIELDDDLLPDPQPGDMVEPLKTEDKEETEIPSNIHQLPSVAELEADSPSLQEQMLEASKKQHSDPYYGYSREPSIPSQLSQFPVSVKSGALRVKLFDLSDERDLEDYAQLMADADQAGGKSPRVKIDDYQRKDFKGSWKVLVHYHELWYKSLIK